jgi:16S rRNA (guanine(966)-N(2))-methyltransferase RsmD
VERDARAVAALRRNIAALGLEAQARVLREDARRALARLAREGEVFHLVFLDPPYQSDLAGDVLVALGKSPVLAPPAMVVAQHLTKRPPPSEAGVLRAHRTRRFGETTLTFFRGRAYDASTTPPPAAGEC